MADDDVVSEPSVGQMDDLRTRAAVLEQKLDELKQESNARLLRAAMKVEAVRAGMLDLDGLKLLDLSGVKLNDEGEVVNASEVMEEFKRAKPWLFGSASSSSTMTPPSAQPPRHKHATEMTNTEYAVARAALIKQRF